MGFDDKAQDAYKESIAFLMQTSKRFVIILSVTPSKQRRRLLDVLGVGNNMHKYATASKNTSNNDKMNTTEPNMRRPKRRPKRRQLMQNGGTSSSGIDIQTDIRELSGATAVEVSERVVQVLKSP